MNTTIFSHDLPVRWCFDGTAPADPEGYTREMWARESYYNGYFNRHDPLTVQQKLQEVAEVANLTALCREVGISRPYVTALVKGDRKKRTFVEPLAKLTIWLDKYHAELLRNKPAILAKRAQQKAAQQRYLARRKAGVPASPLSRALFDLETCDPAALNVATDTQLATIARKLVAEIKRRQEIQPK